jgi:hypothetical protein
MGQPGIPRPSEREINPDHHVNEVDDIGFELAHQAAYQPPLREVLVPACAQKVARPPGAARNRSCRSVSEHQGDFWLNLGTVTVGNVPNSWYGQLDVDLSFLSPGGIGNLNYASDIWATVTVNGPTVYIAFNNNTVPVNFSYTAADGSYWTGSFNLQLSNLGLSAGQSGNLTAYGSGASQVDPPAPSIAIQTPEPGSLVLFGTGLSSLGFLVRRFRIRR